MINFRVKTKTDPNKLARAIISSITNADEIELSCLGAGALNQAIKAIIIARGLATPIGIDLKNTPHFNVITTNGEERTLIDITVSK